MWRPSLESFNPLDIYQQTMWKIPNQDPFKKIDAFVALNDTHVLIFTGKMYHMFVTQVRGFRVVLSNPLTTLGLPQNLTHVDAVFQWGRKKYFYIFSGRLFWKMDSKFKSIFRGYPRPIDVWQYIGYNLDTAFTFSDGNEVVFCLLIGFCI